MATLHIDLTDHENDSLLTIARQRGKSQDELLRDTIQDLISQCQAKDRQALLQSARGIWKNRTDLPTSEDLRREWDRL